MWRSRLAWVHRRAGDPARAELLLRTALESLTPHHEARARTAITLAHLLVGLDRRVEAEACVAGIDADGLPFAVQAMLEALRAMLAIEAGDAERAQLDTDRALVAAARAGQRTSLWVARLNLAGFLLAQGELDRAQALLDLSDVSSTVQEDPRIRGQALALRAILLQLRGDLEAAGSAWDDCLALLHDQRRQAGPAAGPRGEGSRPARGRGLAGLIRLVNSMSTNPWMSRFSCDSPPRASTVGARRSRMLRHFSVTLVSLIALAGCNAAPEGLSISLTPEAPSTTEDLTVVIDSEAVDDNGDSVQYTYRWSRDGEAVPDATAQTLPRALTSKGETWEVSVIPTDGKKPGTAATASAVIVNSPPEVTAAISPENPRTTEALTLDAEGRDPDGDTFTLTYRWILNGSPTELDGKRVPSERTNKGDVWEAVVSANDGEADSEDAVVSVTISNTPPSVEAATVQADGGRVQRSAVLTCVGSGWEDIDEDAEDYTVRWFVNGSEVPGEDGALSGGFVRGDRVTCELTPFDGDDSGSPVTSAPVEVLNTPPTLADVTIAPELPTREDIVVATPGETFDADGDAVTLKYTWFVDGRESGTTASLPSSRFSRDARITVRVTPTDGTDDGDPVTSNEVIGGNNLPEIDGVSLAPTDVFTDTALEATIIASDPDGDALSTVIEWYVNSTKVSHTTATLDGATWFDKDDEIYAIVSASDGEGTSDTLTTRTITVLNSAPSAPELSLDPAEPTAGDDITCVIDTASTDADGDSITYTFAWTVEGAPVRGTTTTYTNDTLSGGDWSEDERVVCTVVASDGEDDSEHGEARTSGLTAELDFPSTGSSTKSGTLGSGGGGAFFRAGDYVTETFKGTGVTDVDELDYTVEMDDRTTSTCKVGTLRFDVMINGTVVDTYSYTGGSTLGRIKFSDVVSFSKIKGTGTDGDEYVLRIESKDTVCPGASSWNWFPGGTFVLNP